MNGISRKKLAFSRSGVSALNRKVERELVLLKDTLARKNVWNYVKWDVGSSLNDFKERGCYLIDGICGESDSGLPDLQCKEFAAMLMVIDTTPVAVATEEGVVGQLLFITDNGSSASVLYSRSYIYTGLGAEWTEWEVCNGSRGPLYEKLQIVEQKIFPLEVTLYVDPPGAQEYTGANENFTISWTIKIAGEQVVPSKLELKVGGTIVEIDDATKTSVTVVANDDRKVELYVEAEGRSARAEGYIKFAYPAYTGLVDDDFSISESNITTELTEMPLVDGRSRAYTYAAHSNKKIIYCYASVYGNLSQVIGPANTNFIHLFEKTNVNINNIAYNVYIYIKINSTEGYLTYNYK